MGGLLADFGFLEREDIWFEIETEKTIDWGRDCLMNGKGRSRLNMRNI